MVKFLCQQQQQNTSKEISVVYRQCILMPEETSGFPALVKTEVHVTEIQCFVH